jgi:hypothetical protein
MNENYQLSSNIARFQHWNNILTVLSLNKLEQQG